MYGLDAQHELKRPVELARQPAHNNVHRTRKRGPQEKYMPAIDLVSEHRRLKELTQRNLLQLIESEFTLAFTMTDLAETEAEAGSWAHAQLLVRKVRQAIEAVRQNSQLVEQQKGDLLQQLSDLEPRLRSIEERVPRKSK